MDKVNLLIVDDEALIREGLRSLLEKENFISAIHEAWDEDTFFQQQTNHKIDIVLMDIRLRKSNGLELLKKLEGWQKHPKVIVVTGVDGIELIISLLKSGVHSIVYKLDGYTEILKAIKTILTSDTYFPENILKTIQSNVHRWDNIPPVLLTFQEMEMLRAIAKGETTKELAAELKMSQATAETYRVRLMKKVGVPNTAALLAYAYRNGIL